MSKTKIEVVRYIGVPSFVPKKKRPRALSKLKSCNSSSAVPINRLMLPDETEPFHNQVGGHMYEHGKEIGMLKYKEEFVLKPITKPMCGEREIRFYEELETSKDPVLEEMKHFVPGYHGIKDILINGKDVPCLVLDDVTKGLKEPCVMDIKIGKRTWDPLATEDKIKNENKKYVESKEDVGFCIPGFQVRNLSDGKLHKFGKDYGKKLNGESIREALKIYLNGETTLCRPLLMQLLGILWRILHWCRNQRKLRLYASSILLVYDARLLRHYIQNNRVKSQVFSSSDKLKRFKLHRPLSLAVNSSCDDESRLFSPGFSGQFTSDGPKFERTLSFNSADISSVNSTNSHWKKTFKKLQRNHSFCNNYEENLKHLKKNYEFMLDDLVDDGANLWANVKMIDFAHVFPSEGNTLDNNYLQGIENLVKILESFLDEAK